MSKIHPFTPPVNDTIIDDTPFVFDEESQPYQLPTGNELMSGTIKSGGMSRTEKEIDFVITSVRDRLDHLYRDQLFETHKLKLLMFAFTCSLIALLLIFFGLRLTILFDTYKSRKKDYIAVSFGGLFFLPMLYLLCYLCFPNKVQYKERKKIKKERRDRKRPTFFNQLVEDAEKATEPPPRLIKVTAKFRKKDYIVIGSTWKDFCEEFERMTGLPMERQLIRYEEEDLLIDLTKKMDKDYGLDNGSRVFVYNKGGLFTKDARIKKQYEEILEHETLKLKSLRDKQQKEMDEEKGRKISELFKKVSGDPTYQTNKNRKNSQSSGAVAGKSHVSFSEELGHRSTSSGGNDQGRPSFSHKKKGSFRGDDSGENNDGDNGGGSMRKKVSFSV
jgi:hypothetical protein